MTTPRDDIGLSERLRIPWDDGFAIHAPRQIELEAATQLDALSARVKELEAVNRLLDDTGDLLQARVKELEAAQTADRINHTSLCRSLTARATRAEQERDTLSRVMEDTARELGCASDNEAILEAIARLRQERDEAYERAAQQAEQFAPPHSIDLGKGHVAWRIAAAIRRLAAGDEKEK